MRPRGPAATAVIVTVAALALAGWAGATGTAPASGGCSHWGRPGVAADPRPGALRVFAIQFKQHPVQMRTAADYARAIDCALRIEVVPRLARHRPNLVVFDEDVGLQALAIGPRGAGARALLRSGVPSCQGQSLCPTVRTVGALDTGYARALAYLAHRFPRLPTELGQAFVAATDEFVRAFMATMARAARRYGIS